MFILADRSRNSGVAARAPALQAGCRGFESLSAHQINPFTATIYLDVLHKYRLRRYLLCGIVGDGRRAGSLYGAAQGFVVGVAVPHGHAYGGRARPTYNLGNGGQRHTVVHHTTNGCVSQVVEAKVDQPFR